jgi:hypothetical protein
MKPSKPSGDQKVSKSGALALLRARAGWERPEGYRHLFEREQAILHAMRDCENLNCLFTNSIESCDENRRRNTNVSMTSFNDIESMTRKDGCRVSPG